MTLKRIFWHVALLFVEGYCSRHLCKKNWYSSYGGGWYECPACEARRREIAERREQRSARFEKHLESLRGVSHAG